MSWIVRLIETGPAGQRRSVDVMEIERPGDLGEVGNLGLSLAEGKQLLRCVQQNVVAAQAREHLFAKQTASDSLQLCASTRRHRSPLVARRARPCDVSAPETAKAPPIPRA